MAIAVHDAHRRRAARPLGSKAADLVPVLTEEDVAWHHPWRFEVAEHLLRKIYDQDDADVAENMKMLHVQTAAFLDLLAAMRRRDLSTHWLTYGLHSPDRALAAAAVPPSAGPTQAHTRSAGRMGHEPEGPRRVGRPAAWLGPKAPARWRIHPFVIWTMPLPLLERRRRRRRRGTALAIADRLLAPRRTNEPIPGFNAVVHGSAG